MVNRAMKTTYDAIIIGAGHNGLVTAAYLAQAGRSVLVVERRENIGGAAATEDVFPGFQVNTGSNEAGLFLPEVIADLKLAQHGLDFIESPALVHALQPNGAGLTLWRDQSQTINEIAKLSTKDAEKFPAFAQLICQLSGVLQGMLTRTPPSMPEYQYGELFSWASIALKLKRLGNRDMVEFLRVLPMPVDEFLDSWFESDTLKGALGSVGVMGTMRGPLAPGTALMLLYNAIGASAGSVRTSRFVRGGTGQLSAALAAAARGFGAKIETGLGVAKIKLADDQATGILLDNGETIQAKAIISNTSPAHTFFKLVGAPELETNFVRAAKNIKYRGSTARINLALSQLPNFAADTQSLSGHVVICPDLYYLEHAYDDAKYGRISEKPSLDMVIPTLSDPSLAPDGQHLLSIDVRYAPYQMREATWDDETRQLLSERVIDLLAGYASNIKDSILHQQVLTPLDYEQEYGLPEGSIYHGQMGLDQMLIARPVGGYTRYRTPIERLYLCGAGTHPGGGVTGAPGYNAAHEILKDGD